MFSKISFSAALAIVCLCFANKHSWAQQNCFDATPICQTSYSQVNANSGTGSLNDLTSSNQGCLTNGEVNSSWYILNTTTAGNLVFTITPNSAGDDYDFAVWDITDTNCQALANGSTPIRCNFASLANSSPGGLTGLNTTATLPSYGAAGPSFSSAITATAGQTFVILVNNNSNSSNGYTISFAGSTSNIVDNTAPQVKNVQVPPSCNGPSTIKVQFKENIKCSSISSNGSEFSISGGIGISSATATGCGSGAVFSSAVYLTFNSALSPGTYTLTINNGSDGNSLMDNCGNLTQPGTTFTFTVLPKLSITVNTQFGCSGSTSGSISAAGSGGYSPYTYKLNSGTFNTGNTFNALSAGSYTVTVKDSFGCTKDTIITLAPAPPIVITGLSYTNLTCFSASNGSITITASGGNAPLTYAVNSQPYSSNNTISNLGPGSYVVHTKDANGCIKDTTILLTSPGAILYSSLAIQNVPCAGGNNGSINVIGSGGTAPLQYALNTGAYGSFGNFTNLSSGTYTLHIKDANNCIKDTVIVISQPLTALIANVANIIQPNCNGGTGSITGGASGGSSPFQYSINGNTYGSSSIFSGLSSGTYTIYVKDAGNCIATATASLTTPGNLAYTSASIVQPTCTALGSITVTASGGTPPITYALNTGAYSSSSSYTSLSAGSYTIHAKDNNGCIHDTIITLNTPAVPQIAISAQTNVTCSSPTSGALSVAASGGSTPYQYAFNGGAYASTASFTSLSAGTYTITVQGANGCTSSVTAIITSSNTLGFSSFVKTNVACSGSPLGSISSTGSGGASPYTYSINGGAFGASGNFSALSAGTYTIVVKDASGCTASSTTTVYSSPTISISATVVNATCSNPGNGSITTIASGGYNGVLTYYFNGTSNGSSNVVNSLSPGTYTVSVIDGLGCTKSTTVTITGPPFLWFTNTTLVLPPCYGGVGSISTNGIGGAPPYTYANGTGTYGSSGTFNNLPAGTYTIHVKDNNGCIHDTIINLIQPPPVASGTPVVSNAACNGNATGSITLTASGGTPSYQFNINNGAWGSSGAFPNLAAGTYTIGIKDANGCTGQTIVNINSNGNFYYGSSSNTAPSCYNGNNGTLTFTGTGGTTPYTYNINNGTYVSTNTFTNLSPGTYTVYVKDAGGCIVTSLANVSNTTQVNAINITAAAPSCFNGANGSLSLSGSGGAGAYTYAINGGAFVSSGSFTSLSPATYTLTVKDANNCTATTAISVPNTTAIGFSNVSTIPPGCLGSGSGSVTVVGNGGTGPYTYAVNGGTFITPGTFNSLGVGTYTFTVKDANNCTNTTTLTLTMAAGVQVNSVVLVTPSCVGLTNGSITVAAATLNNPLSYSLNGGPSQGTGIFSALGAGTYTVSMIDMAGCFRDTVVTLSALSSLSFSSVNATNVLCYGGTSGSITATAGGGTGISYAINGGSFGSNNNFTNLTNATYTITAQDNAGCNVSTLVTLTSPPQMIFTTVNITAPYCNGSQDGSITIGGIGGVSPLSYNINNTPYSSVTTYSNLIQATYTFHIKDANGCIIDTSIFLQGPDVVYFSVFNIQNVSCFGASDGVLTANAAGGIAPYNYSLNNSPFTVVNQFTSLPAGSYTLIAQDNQGCINDTVVNINAPGSSVGLSVVNIVDNICRGDSMGSVTVQGTGGTSPFMYSYFVTGNFGFSNTLSNLPAGLVTVYVKDANNCPYDTTIAVAEPDSSAQIVLLGTVKNSCVGVYDGQILVSAKNGVAPYTYFVNGSSNGTDSVFDNLAPGDYVIEVQDNIGCLSTGKYTLDSTDRRPSLTITSLNNNVCIYDQIGSFAWQYNAAYYPVQVYIDSVLTIDSSATNLESKTYAVHMVDDRGCTYDTTAQIVYTDSLSVTTVATPAKCDGLGNDGAARAFVSGGPGPYLYDWGSPGTTTVDSIGPIDYGTYTLEVTDAKGCKDTSIFKVIYEPCCSAFVPNAFTPNGDDVNDYVPLRPFGPIKFLSFEIYNRWGQKVFTALSFDDKWDGRFNGQECELSTYYYFLRYTCPLNEGVQVQKGDITLIK